MRHRLIPLFDQGLGSAANLLFSMGVVRIFGTADFAAYSFGLTIALMLQSIQRMAYIVPLSMSAPALARRRRHGFISAHILLLVLLFAMTLAAYGLAILSGASTLLRGALASTTLCLALYGQIEMVRVLAIKAGKPIRSLYFTSAISMIFLLVLAGGHFKIIRFETGMLAAGAMMLAIGFFALHSTGRLHWRSGILRLRHIISDTLGWATVGTVASWGYSHVPLFALGAFAQPIHAAAFAACRSLMQPLQILARSADLVDKHQLSAIAAHDKTGQWALLRRFLLRNIALSGVFALVIGILAAPMLVLIYGPEIAQHTATLRLWVLVFVLLPFVLLLEGFIHTFGLLGAYTRVQIFGGIAASALSIVLVMRWQDPGAVTACLVGWIIVLGGMIWLVRSRIRHKPEGPAAVE